MPWMVRNARPQITLLGLFGSGNLGNDATLSAVIEAILSRLPQTKLQCICANPSEVTKRFSIAAAPLNYTGTSRPLGRWTRLFWEWRTYGTALRMLWRTNILIFCGTNLFSDYLTGPTGWPYDIFKWTLVSRFCGANVVLLGAGVGPVVNPISRWLLKHSLGLAVFRSYRDETSMQWARDLGAGNALDTLSPDVVFGLSVPAAPVSPPDRTTTIGIGLKDYPEVEGVDGQRHRAYVATMATFIAALLQDGFRVRLLIGDFVYDPPVVQEVADAVRKLHPATESLLISTPQSVDELIECIRRTDVVISPRFHNLVLGLLLGKPVASLSDHHKLDEVARQFDLERYCVRLDTVKAEELIDTTRKLLQAAPELAADLAAKLADYQRILHEQYDEMLRACGLNHVGVTSWDVEQAKQADLAIVAPNAPQNSSASLGGIPR